MDDAPLAPTPPLAPASAAADHLGSRWMIANAIGAMIAATCSGLGDGVLRLSADGTMLTPFALRTAVMALLLAIGLAGWAYFTGQALRQKLPAMPVRGWTLLHATIGAAVGIVLSYLGPDDEPVTVEGLGEVGWLIIGAAGAGFIVGGVMGEVHRLVLRRAATGLSAWTGYSALGGLSLGLLAPVAVYAPTSGLWSTLALEAAGVACSLVWALAMVRALRRIEPKEAAP